MNVAVLGQGTLADATYENCAREFYNTCRHVWPDADVVWVCYDTPLGEDIPDFEWVHDRIDEQISRVSPWSVVLVSSQMPVGTIARLERRHPNRRFAYSPENIRVKTAVADFSNQARIVVGTRHETDRKRLRELLTPFTDSIIFTDPETAEMAKHTLNAFLALQIAYINEIARLAGPLNVDMNFISDALLSERRVSPQAPLRHGGPFGGGHLARDLTVLEAKARHKHIDTPLLDAITISNAQQEALCLTQ